MKDFYNDKESRRLPAYDFTRTLLCVLFSGGVFPPLVVHFLKMKINTFSNGCLGSHNDEERSEMRYVLRIAASASHQNFERTLHFLRGVCLLECLFIPTTSCSLHSEGAVSAVHQRCVEYKSTVSACQMNRAGPHCLHSSYSR